ncbi:MAG: winged helix-turn-helix domain-containing protein, partial [Pseudomonadota bacterium]
MSTTNRLSWTYVRDEIHKSILAGRYGPGDRLPRDADIAEDLNCARSTVQRAMQDLSDSGLVERRRKGGTRVRAEPVTRAT